MTELLHGVWNCYPLEEARELEGTIRQGESGWAVLYQMTAIYSAIELIGEIGVQIALFGKASQWVKIPVALSPALLYYLRSNAAAEKNGRQNGVLTGIHDGLFSACGVVCALHGVVSIWTGQASRGGAELAVLGYGYFRTYLPREGRAGVDLTLFALTNLARLYLGQWNHRLLALFAIILRLPIGSEKGESVRPLPTPIDPSSLPEVSDLEIQPWHMQAYRDTPVPPPPTVDFSTFATLFEGVDFEKQAMQKVVAKALSQDLRWKKRPDKGDSRAYLKEGIEKLINAFKTETMEVGDLTSFALIKAKAAHVLVRLGELEPEDRTLPLIELAIGAHYCASGVNREVHWAYEELCVLAPDDLFQQINRVLARRRQALFDGFLTLLGENQLSVMQPLYQATDDHWHNVVASLLQRNFGLPNQEVVKEDHLAQRDLSRKVLGQGVGH
ncbi:MAG: hypothetical protein AB7F31_06505 [Parachlamydiales bacterium]